MRQQLLKQPLLRWCCAATFLVGLAISFTRSGGEQAKKAGSSDTPERLIVLLDGYIQTRFEQDEGRFGLSRLPPPVEGHGSIPYDLQASNDREREIVRAVNGSQYEFLVEFLHCPHSPGRLPGTNPASNAMTARVGLTLIAAKSSLVTFKPYSFSKERVQFRKSIEEGLEKQAIAEIPRLKQGSAINMSVSGWRVALRPIRASTAVCLNCHTGAKGGDVLGAVLYAVRPPAKLTDRQGPAGHGPDS